ncbi:MAG: J domain-containing protein [Candidatus Methanoperedens sp.]|nr:J domain-containing protein [Candidatus Methanoperedens sp.]MCE8429391.1 J domain-containing protein [Candidatus Methanoperedens sp.]
MKKHGKKTYYELLEVDKKASQEAIKSAYCRLAMLYHPDKNKLPEAEEMFKKIAEAYAVLQTPASIIRLSGSVNETCFIP